MILDVVAGMLLGGTIGLLAGLGWSLYSIYAEK